MTIINIILSIVFLLIIGSGFISSIYESIQENKDKKDNRKA